MMIKPVAHLTGHVQSQVTPPSNLATSDLWLSRMHFSCQRWKERERERAAEAAAVSRTRIERTVDRDVGGRFAVEAEGTGGGRGARQTDAEAARLPRLRRPTLL